MIGKHPSPSISGYRVFMVFRMSPPLRSIERRSISLQTYEKSDIYSGSVCAAFFRIFSGLKRLSMFWGDPGVTWTESARLG